MSINSLLTDLLSAKKAAGDKRLLSDVIATEYESQMDMLIKAYVETFKGKGVEVDDVKREATLKIFRSIGISPEKYNL